MVRSILIDEKSSERKPKDVTDVTVPQCPQILNAPPRGSVSSYTKEIENELTIDLSVPRPSISLDLQVITPGHEECVYGNEWKVFDTIFPRGMLVSIGWSEAKVTCLLGN